VSSDCVPAQEPPVQSMVAARATPEATTIVAAIAISENIMRFIASSPSFFQGSLAKTTR
jgi:hypothetical protein